MNTITHRLHKTLRVLLNDLEVCRYWAAQSHKHKQYTAWSHWMQTIKQKKRDIRIVAKWLHILLHTYGYTKIAPKLSVSDGLSTTSELEAVVFKNSPTGQTLGISI